MDMISAFAAITMPIVVTILLSGRQTQRIIQTSNQQTQWIIQTSSRQTHRILGKLERCLIEIGRTQRSMQRIQRDTQKCLVKLDFGFKANAVMHGWTRVDGVTPAQARKLPEPKVYDEKLGVCYSKSD
jgi:hypothetical protein